MKKYTVCILSKAEQSIDEQIDWLYLSPWGDGKRLSEHWAGEFDKVLEALVTHPERNGFAPENGMLSPAAEVRQKRFRPWKGKPGWRVLFTTNETAATVTILQIRHERQPWAEG
jgi:plasmid stabilization system protein ParE